MLAHEPRLPDPVKRNGRYNEEDIETVERLKTALHELPDYRFRYLDNHVSGAQATMETSLRCLPRSALDPALEKSPAITSRLTAAIEREVAFLKQTYARSQRSEPLERVAALFVMLSRCNAYEGRDPSHRFYGWVA